MKKKITFLTKYNFFTLNLIPLVMIMLLLIQFIEAKSKNKEEIYLYNISDSKYVQYDRKKHKFILAHLGTPFKLISDKKGNITLTYQGKYFHSKVFDRTLTTSKRSIFHEINQKFSLQYAGNSMFKLRIKHFCVSSTNKSLYEDTCKDYNNGKSQYFYIVPQPYYNRHINLQNNLFKGYNNDIGRCMEMAALNVGQSMMGMNNNCAGFNSGPLSNYMSDGAGHNMGGMYVNMNGRPYGSGTVYSDSSGYKSGNSNSDFTGKDLKSIKNTLKDLCKKVNIRHRNAYDSDSSSDNDLARRSLKKKPSLNKQRNYKNLMKSVSELQKALSLGGNGCLGQGLQNTLGFGGLQNSLGIGGMQGSGGFNQNCLPAYNSAMYMKDNFNNQYPFNIPPNQPRINGPPLYGNMSMSPGYSNMQRPNGEVSNMNALLSSYQGLPPVIMRGNDNISSQNQPYIPNISQISTNQNIIPGISQVPSQQTYGNSNSNNCFYQGTTNGMNSFNSIGSFPGNNQNSQNRFGFNICNDQNIKGPLNLLSDPNCIGSSSGGLYNNQTGGNTYELSRQNMPTMSPDYGAAYYPSGQTPMNSPSTMGLSSPGAGDGCVCYTNTC
ncbi:hypothetical protein CDIK_0337 [Cucumispora dikerogammari]|nr:hypothetical protein CDIK_0337 [Cucumispora dikerogammari]